MSIEMLLEGSPVFLHVFAYIENDRVWMKMVNDTGEAIPGIFNRINLFPDKKTPAEFPEFVVNKLDKEISFRQVLPYQEPDEYDKGKGHPKDKAFSISVVTNSDLEKRQRVDRVGNLADMEVMESAMIKDDAAFWATLSSNHVEINLPYVEMVEFVSDVAKRWAKEYYNMRGTFFPHSAYPVVTAKCKKTDTADIN